MKPDDLLRRLKRLATRRGWEFEVRSGRGSHVQVTLNGRITTVGKHKKDIKTGTFHGTLRDLSVTKEDLDV